MKFDGQKALDWLTATATALPSLREILEKAVSEVLVVGAGVFDVYFGQGWTPAFKRKTADLDLSVGLYSGKNDYEILRRALLEHQYVPDPQINYRYFSPRKIPGGLTYIDLLAHPLRDQVGAQDTKQVMGVGPDFSFAGFQFARLGAFAIIPRLICPNPLGMVGLKRAAYLDNPDTRIKDLADIAELAWGIVEKGTHFEMKSLWNSVKAYPEAGQVRLTLIELGSDSSTIWDLSNARQELLKRNFTSSEIDELIPQRLKEWASYLPI